MKFEGILGQHAGLHSLVDLEHHAVPTIEQHAGLRGLVYLEHHTVPTIELHAGHLWSCPP